MAAQADAPPLAPGPQELEATAKVAFELLD